MRGRLLLAGSAALLACRGASIEVLTGPTNTPAPGSCALAAPAFCDPLGTPHPGGRGGDLDESVWSVARLTFLVNPAQGYYGCWTPSNALFCGERNRAVLPDGDFRICGGRLEETADDGSSGGEGSGLVLHSMRVRQPLDFSGSGATVAFDVDAKVVVNATWLEVWIADQPVVAAFGKVFESILPSNGVGLQMGVNRCPAGSAGKLTGLDDIALVRNYQIVTQREVNDVVCFPTLDGKLNHFELRINQNHVELWATDLNDRLTLRRVGWRDVAIPFSVGYVSFGHVEYQAGKHSDQSAHTYRWANIGFDGARHPTPRAAQVPDLLAPKANCLNLGYWVEPAKSPGRVLSVAGVSTAGATRAWLAFSIFDFEPSTALTWRLNAGPWHDHPFTYATSGSNWTRAEVVAVKPDELRDGANTIEFTAQTSSVISNVDLTVSTEP